MGRTAGRVGAGLIGSVALVLAIAACGQDEPEIGFGAPPPAQETTEPQGDPEAPQGPTPPPGTRALAVDQVDVSALPEGYPSLVWTTDDPRTVGMYGQEGGCSTVTAEVVQQDADRVLIRLVESSESEGPCTMDLRFPDLTVTLDEPLDDRTVALEQVNLGVVPGRGGPTG